MHISNKERKLLVDLMTIDKLHWDKATEIEKIFDAELSYDLLGSDQVNGKEIATIVFDYLDIPQEKDKIYIEEIDEEIEYCRDRVFDVYYHGLLEGNLSVERTLNELVIMANEGGFEAEEQEELFDKILGR
jgi:hypothetical protein